MSEYGGKESERLALKLRVYWEHGGFRPLPDDIDLDGVRYMTLEMDRLKKSRAWLKAKSNPALGFYLLNLWMRAVVERPAGSIEDDDDVLADAAVCTLREWRKVKAECLRGWELHGGRWHNKVVAEIALGMWLARLKSRFEGALGAYNAKVRRARGKGQQLEIDFPASFHAWMVERYPKTLAYLLAVEAEPLDADNETGRVASGDEGETSERREGNVGATTDERRGDFASKVREGDTPLDPPSCGQVRSHGPPDGSGGGSEGRGEPRPAQARAHEVMRLQREFGTEVAGRMREACSAGVAREGRGGAVDFVSTFWGARTKNAGGLISAVLMPIDCGRRRFQQAVRVVGHVFGDGVDVRRAV